MEFKPEKDWSYIGRDSCSVHQLMSELLQSSFCRNVSRLIR